MSPRRLRVRTFGSQLWPWMVFMVVAIVTLTCTALVWASEDDSGLTNRGTSTAATSSDKRVLERLAQVGATVARLAIRGDRAFYRVGAECYGTGPAGTTSQRLGHVVCSPGFPEREPILDLTVFGGTMTATGEVVGEYVVRSEGFAADSVNSVALRNNAGTVVAQSAVVANVYRMAVPPGADVAEFVALDDAGSVVYARKVTGRARSGGNGTRPTRDP